MVRPPNLWLALAAGLVAAAVVAVFVAYFSTRLRDIYFSITTSSSRRSSTSSSSPDGGHGGENGLTFRQPPLAFPGLFSIPFTRNGLHWSCWRW